MTASQKWTPDRRDMIWIDSNPQTGREIRDVHPLLVLSPKAFNARTGIVIGLPMTSATFNETNPFAIKFWGPGKKASYILGQFAIACGYSCADHACRDHEVQSSATGLWTASIECKMTALGCPLWPQQFSRPCLPGKN